MDAAIANQNDNLKSVLQEYQPPEWAAHLKNLPHYKVKLAQNNTEIHEWSLSGVPNGFEIGIKRDDNTGGNLSGNKVRKLEFTLAEALHQGCDTVFTLGSIYSNHCRSTAIAARRFGMTCYLFMRQRESTTDVGCLGNLLLNRLTGTHMILTEYQPYDITIYPKMNMLREKLEKENGSKVYVIPAGGSSNIAMFSYLQCFKELVDQDVLKNFTDIVVTIGSGGTASGLAIGNYLTGSHLKIHAVNIRNSVENLYQHVQEDLDHIGLSDVKAEDILDIMDGHKGLGYGLSTEEELEHLVQIACETGITLDPIYTLKSARGMLAEMKDNPCRYKGKKVLFMHTGGMFGLFEGRMNRILEKLNVTSRIRYWANGEDVPVF
ncbi:putative D-cysteine desulfhydrase 1, mitochondrial isoform X2 [Exaiptasia diaphana]|uniref:Tryptophan synthase beta chain-like PALP domain-containing protein n=1 Tax=Exaiptasia diaphana TaxID=2652724 RepID=A0A913Y433_EXADI|nr:putative D-cysteine desulfhydrase 1, mitochondrial isoform X2 [Exaiptasia diaphana]